MVFHFLAFPFLLKYIPPSAESVQLCLWHLLHRNLALTHFADYYLVCDKLSGKRQGLGKKKWPEIF